MKPPDQDISEQVKRGERVYLLADVDALRSVCDRYRETLERIASPNRWARPTGADALRMAAAAREALGDD